MHRDRARRIRCPLFLYDTRRKLYLGTTDNMSASGFFVETTARIPVGSHVHLQFVWDLFTHEVESRVVRQEPHGLALSFVRADPYARYALEEAAAIRPLAEN